MASKKASELLSDSVSVYGNRGGPLPNYPSNNVISVKFWLFYSQPKLPKAMRGTPGTIGYKAALAGFMRQKVEPNIDPHTDPRAKNFVQS